MEREVTSFKEELVRLVWYMRGGLSYNEVYSMDIKDREIVSRVVKDNLETTRKSGLPFF